MSVLGEPYTKWAAAAKAENKASQKTRRDNRGLRLNSGQGKIGERKEFPVRVQKGTKVFRQLIVGDWTNPFLLFLQSEC